jgi:hypothetical protein
MWTRAIISGVKTAVVVAVSAGLISLIDSLIRTLTGADVPAWLVPWSPVLVAVAGVIKALVKRWELSHAVSNRPTEN